MADYITEMANQIVAMSRRIDAIESDRVARLAELERKVGEQLSGLRDMLDEIGRADGVHREMWKGTVPAMRSRIEALERDHTIERQAHRIDALEKRIGELEDLSSRCGAGWATEIKSSVAALERIVVDERTQLTSLYYRFERHVEHGDRAHGPLEAKAVNQDWMKTPHGICNHKGIGLPGCKLCDPSTKQPNGWDPNTHATVRSYTSYGQTTHWARLEDVNALVRAARAACDLALPDSVGYDLTLALEPFETERGK